MCCTVKLKCTCQGKASSINKPYWLYHKPYQLNEQDWLIEMKRTPIFVSTIFAYVTKFFAFYEIIPPPRQVPSRPCESKILWANLQEICRPTEAKKHSSKHHLITSTPGLPLTQSADATTVAVVCIILPHHQRWTWDLEQTESVRHPSVLCQREVLSDSHTWWDRGKLSHASVSVYLTCT